MIRVSNTDVDRLRNTHVVFLMSVVLHKRDDAVVNEKCKRENPTQLRKQRSEL